jgi:hypothetical protein
VWVLKSRIGGWGLFYSAVLVGKEVFAGYPFGAALGEKRFECFCDRATRPAPTHVLFSPFVHAGLHITAIDPLYAPGLDAYLP